MRNLTAPWSAWGTIADGNATTETGGPLFTLRPDDTGRAANIFTLTTLDIDLGLYYQMSVIASNRPLNVTEACMCSTAGKAGS